MFSDRMTDHAKTDPICPVSTYSRRAVQIIHELLRMMWTDCDRKLFTFCNFRPPQPLSIRASSVDTAVVEAFESADVLFKETFPLKRIEKNHVDSSSRASSASSLPMSQRETPRFRSNFRKAKAFSLNYAQRPLSHGSSFCNFRPPQPLSIRASSVDTAVVEAFESADVLFKETFPLKRIEKVEGNISIKLDNGKDKENWQLTVGCNLPGKWVLHWGVNYVNDVGSEWDQPPVEMRPPGSVPIKDEETGAWYQHRGRDFKVALIDYLHEDGNKLGAKRGLGVWPGPFEQLSSLLLKSEEAHPNGEDSSESRDPSKKTKRLEGFYEEYSIVREVLINNLVSVSSRKCPKTAKYLLHIETDIPGDVVIHWGVCKDDGEKWEIPAEPYPAETIAFKNKALRTLLKNEVSEWRRHDKGKSDRNQKGPDKKHIEHSKSLKDGRHGSGVNNLSAKNLKFWFQPHKKLIGSVASGLVIVPKSHPDLPLPPRKRRTERDQEAKFYPFNSSQVIRAPGVCWDREKSGRGGGGGTTTFSTLSTSEPSMMEPEKGRQQQERLPQGKRQVAGLAKKRRGAGEPREVAGESREGWARARLASRRGCDLLGVWRQKLEDDELSNDLITLTKSTKWASKSPMQKQGGQGGWSLFTLDEGYVGFVFVLKINENTWLNYMGNDFYIPLSSSSALPTQPRHDQSEGHRQVETDQAISPAVYNDGIINEIRSLVSDISSEKSRQMKSKEAQESILQEIEKLAAEAYSIFRSSIPTYSEDVVVESEEVHPPAQISSGTGSGFEILCQGFNWESHKSGRWYMELLERAAEISSLGFTVVWLPPPTESVSPEGYMPRDLYNLNSRYGNVEELKLLVKRFHEVGIRVLGDVVLNHRCAQYKNQNGVWNIFGGRLNWDDRAVVADDPHFEGRGNKSSGDNFHAAPNIDHSQEFVRNDLKEWLCWLRKEIGYDGWRLDFVRGFWGGYVKDYLDASEPYFAVGEYWDSLSYTYGEMDHNQDAHRQRIIDWINATSGTAGAFDVTTKGVLHSALERCEYWRLSDQKGKPPGVVGWWPSRAVTFIENHDTGSTQGHWRFPGGKEMQGYAYILTHPGTPAVFYDHAFSHMRSEISALVSLRNRKKIHCRSTIQITKAERDVYAAMIDEKVAMKIGPGYYEPASGPQRWSVAVEGKDYKVWEAS
ncbi:alpha-amylase-like 3 [Actinidia rufa]|uniref:alpha-amylase n=1 Tax=Actinidia rufa TaxID=165716 RepID=A0A7J0DTD6_9ERIC|nr:alpha-amylase-like 3 [Actinidia rufa]